MKQFKVTTGNGVWFDLYHSDDDLDNPAPILKDNGELSDAFEGLDDGTPICDLETAKIEAKIQFFGHTWTVSNGEIAFTKGGKVQEVTEEIFGPAKPPIPELVDIAVRRDFSGMVKTEKIHRGNGHAYHGIDRCAMTAASLSV